MKRVKRGNLGGRVRGKDMIPKVVVEITLCVCVCVCARVRACVRACVRPHSVVTCKVMVVLVVRW